MEAQEIFSYFAKGKILLTGEYGILDGSRALAIPTVCGQTMRVEKTTAPFVEWSSTDKNNHEWFKATFSISGFETLSSNDPDLSKTLAVILNTVNLLSPALFNAGGHGYKISVKTGFERDWGLGTSATLITCISKWADIDPFILNNEIFGGSGYDIACAEAAGPILFERQDKISVHPVHYKPEFYKKLWLIHLNTKQNSRKGIALYRAQSKSREFIDTLSTLTDLIVETQTDFSLFCSLIEQHEQAVSAQIGLPAVKSAYFADFDGVVKSLGAWGGDMVLAASDRDSNYISAYFNGKGFTTILWADQILYWS